MLQWTRYTLITSGLFPIMKSSPSLIKTNSPPSQTTTKLTHFLSESLSISCTLLTCDSFSPPYNTTGRKGPNCNLLVKRVKKFESNSLSICNVFLFAIQILVSLR